MASGDEGKARLVARAAGCWWLLLGGGFVVLSIFAAAISVGAFVIALPWAVVAIVLAWLLLARAPTRWLLIASTVAGCASALVALLASAGSTEDFYTFIASFVLASLAAASYSVLALRRLPGDLDPAE